VRYLEEFGWEVHQEVQLHSRGPVADIVATRGPLLRIVEVKTSLTAAVCEQAIRWKIWNVAHFIHVASPGVHRIVRGRWALRRLLQHEGIGLFQLRMPSIPAEEKWVKYCEEEIRPRFFRRADWVDRMLDRLNEETRTFAEAGNADGERWSPWKQTCRDWARYVAKHPGATLKQMVDNVAHHYHSDTGAKTSMVKWIREGKVPGIELRREGRLIRLYLADDAPPRR
jgi:hypothetical protein